MPRLDQVRRRQFLKGMAAATFGAPLVVSPSAFGLNGSTAPSERITMGFIGVGKQCYGHVCYMAGRSDVQVLAVCDVQETSARRARPRWSMPIRVAKAMAVPTRARPSITTSAS